MHTPSGSVKHIHCLFSPFNPTTSIVSSFVSNFLANYSSQIYFSQVFKLVN